MGPTWGAISLMLGGVMWLVLGLSNVFGYLQAIPGREDVVLLVLALLLTATGLVGLHALQGDSYGLLGRVSLYTVLLSLAARSLGAVVFLAGSSTLEWISLPGTLGMLVPLATYGTALFGLILVVLGYALWLRKDTITAQPPRVR